MKRYDLFAYKPRMSEDDFHIRSVETILLTLRLSQWNPGGSKWEEY